MDKIKKVNFLTQYYYPDIASTGQLMTELAEMLAKRGMDIYVYTTKPSYVKKGDAPKFEIHNNVKINRVFCFNANKNIPLGRTINTISFLISIFIKLLFTDRKAINFIVSTPPLLLFVGYFLFLIKRQKYVLLIYDIYPDVAVALDYFKKDSLIVKIWDWFNKRTISKAERTVVLSEGMKRLILSKFENPDKIKDKMSIIHNWADDKFFKLINKEDNYFIKNNNLSNKFILLYSGNLALYNSFDTILETAKIINDPDILFLIIGNGGRKKEIEDYIKLNSLNNVRMMDYLPFKELPYSISSADATFVTVRDGIDGINMPSKLYTIMACGKPILALGKRGGDVHNMIENAKCGIFIEQGNTKELFDAIMFYKNNPDILNEHGLNGRKYFETHYTLEIISNQYFELFSGIK